MPSDVTFSEPVSESENRDDNYNYLFAGREIKQKVHVRPSNSRPRERSVNVSCCPLLPLARLSYKQLVPGCFSGLQNILQGTCLLHGSYNVGVHVPQDANHVQPW